MEVVTVFLVVPLVTLNAYFLGKVNHTRDGRCPHNFEERLARSELVNCTPVEKYHCLFNSDDVLVEACSDYKQLPPGNYPRFNSYATGNPIDYEACPADRFQPWPVKSYEISECLSIKTTCSGEGQEICDPGTDRKDRTCKCDYKSGYAMNGGVCCSPSELPDCFCYKKICGLHMELDEGYNCIKCSIANTDESGSTSSENVTLPYRHTSTFKSKETEKFVHIQKTAAYASFIAVAIFCFFCFISFWRMMRRHKYTEQIKKTIYLMCFALVLIGNCVFSTFIYLEMIPVDYRITLTVLFVVPVFGCVCAMTMIFTYEIRKDPVVFNEDYEIRIFKLLTAASGGDITEMQRLKNEQFIDMEDVDYDSRSALHLAACSNQIKAVDFIVKHHLCFPQATDRWNRSAEHDVKWHQKQNNDDYNEVLEKLMKYKEQYQSRKKEKTHFREIKAMELIKAAEKGDLHTIKRLFKLGTDMNLPNSAGRTSLHAAAKNGMKDIVDYLIDKCEVSPFVRWNNERPIDILKDDENEVTQQISEKLQSFMDDLKKSKAAGKEATPPEDVQIVRLLNCASRGDIKRMRQFKECGYNMDACDYDKRTALHIAVSDNQEHIVKFLLGECDQQGIAKNGADRWNVTPWEAAKTSALEIVYNEFLNHCSELKDTENDDYRTCRLIYAAANGDVPTLQSLHEKKVDMNLRDYDGRTALHLAAANGHVEAVEFLVKEAKVTVSIPDRESRIPMNDKNEDIQKLLTKYKNNAGQKAKLSVKDETLTILMMAASKGYLHTLKDFKYTYFKMDSGDYLKETPLHVAAAKGRLDDVKYLLHERQVSPFARNSFWKMPVDLVNEKIKFWEQKGQESRKEDFKEVKDVLQKAMDAASDESIEKEEDKNFIKHSDEERIFLFLNRAYKGDLKTIRRYLKTDTTLCNQMDYDKRSALHMAVAEGHIHLVKYLLKHGADKFMKDRWGRTPSDEAKKSKDEDMIILFENEYTNI